MPVLLSIICGGILTVVGVLIAENVLILMGTPDTVLPLATKYLKGKKPEYFAENIEITGGIWNFNNKEQHTNPFITDVKIPDYSGYGMLFIGIKGFRFSSLTLKDPVTFAVTLDTVSYFTVDNIVFDFPTMR